MALDAVAVKALVAELQCLVGGRVDKVHQPERDEIAIGVRTYDESFRLLISASPAHPRIHLSTHSKSNPKTAPLFCMLLRKHLASGRITAITQVGFERIVKVSVESYDELGDYTEKSLYVEIMGRHSNVILVNNEGRIIDSIKRIDESMSSVREILPGGVYELPPIQSKTALADWETENDLEFLGTQKVDKAIISQIAGISPLTAREMVYNVFGTTDVLSDAVNTNRYAMLKLEINKLKSRTENNDFEPCMIEDTQTGKLVEFSAIPIEQYETLAKVVKYESMSELVDEFYYKRDVNERMRQKTADLVKLLNNHRERIAKKMAILRSTLSDAEKMDTYREYGDLITANIYRIQEGHKSVELENYFDENMKTVKITLDPSLSPSQNAQKYYKKYNKSKTALKEAQKQLEQSAEELEYIESTLAMVETADRLEDISVIRRELANEGYIKRSTNAQKKQKAEQSKPMHFVSSDGFDIYVGRNNTQNDYLTLKLANSSDLWFHTKDIHGSHTVIKLGLDKDVPKQTILEAAALAAYYSKARESSQVPVDYTTIKNVKKPNGAKPGMVIYEHYNTVYIKPELLSVDNDKTD
ncbi:MAG: NFACT family protein [Clostridia bacterium]|nr:NFACT family protein [Clostridia bacterium]MEE0410733.1 NFACT RNA binding domain-containing protein [Clostridia bacterium]